MHTQNWRRLVNFALPQDKELMALFAIGTINYGSPLSSKVEAELIQDVATTDLPILLAN